MVGNPGKPENVDLRNAFGLTDDAPAFISQQPLVTFEDYALLVAMHAFVSAQPRADVADIVTRSLDIADSLSICREEALAARRKDK